MSIRRLLYALFSTVLICWLCGIAIGESAKKEKASEIAFDRIGSIMRPYMDALGNTMQKKGYEKKVLIGDYWEDGKSKTRVKATIQMPRMAKLEGFKNKNSVLAFDGKSKKNAQDRTDNALLDTFLIDTAEGMMQTLQELGAMRPLGLGFKTDAKNNHNNSGLSYDIYEIKHGATFINDLPLQPRLYYFDSKTQMLHRTIYYDNSGSKPVKIETRFTEWQRINGSSYPAVTERYENDQRVFSFTTTSVESGPADDVEKYR